MSAKKHLKILHPDQYVAKKDDYMSCFFKAGLQAFSKKLKTVAEDEIK
jgi:hypothetical protein